MMLKTCQTMMTCMMSTHMTMRAAAAIMHKVMVEAPQRGLHEHPAGYPPTETSADHGMVIADGSADHCTLLCEAVVTLSVL